MRTGTLRKLKEQRVLGLSPRLAVPMRTGTLRKPKSSRH